MYSGNVRLLSELDGDSPADESREPEEHHSSWSTKTSPDEDRHFAAAFEKYGGIDPDKERPKSRLSGDATFEERRAHSIKTLDEALDEKLTAYEAEQEDRKAFESEKGLGARDYFHSTYGNIPAPVYRARPICS